MAVPQDYIEATGDAIGAIIEGFKRYPEMANKYLVQYGIYRTGPSAPVFDRNAWYPLHSWLAAFNAIARELGDGALIKIGESVPKHVAFPPAIRDVESALRSIDVAFHMAHRKNGVPMFDPKTGTMSEGIGHYTCIKTATCEMRVECDEPYPCAFDQGVISGMAHRFAPRALVTHELGACRGRGGVTCTYRVVW